METGPDGGGVRRGIAGASAAGEELSVLTSNAGSALTSVLQELTAQGVAIASVSVEKPDLETVFLHVTGKALRD